MNLGRTVFAQLISFLPDREFRRGVSRYDGIADGAASPAGISSYAWRLPS